MTRNKAIIFDIDGTAIDSPVQKLPTKRLVEAMRAVEKSFYLCAATGRVWPFAENIIKGMKLSDPCIISGGTQICDPQTEKILWQSTLDPSDAQAALEVMKQYPNYLVIFNEYTEEDYLNGGTSPAEVELNRPIYILEQKFVPKDVGPEIVAKLSVIEGVTVTLATAQKPDVVDIHVTNRGATKEQAVAKLLEMIGVDRTNTIGIGDGHNDIHLFNAVGHKVAMENAEPELKEKADQIIGHVSNDDFAVYLEGLAKKEN